MATTSCNGSSSSNSSRTTLRSTNHSAEVPESPRRRRTRPAQSTTDTDSNSMSTTTTTTTATATTWSSVKQDFIKTVSGAVAELMEEYGYSRERATGAVLREISEDKTKTPQDIEIFQTMRRYGLGSEHAVKAMTVSEALERTIAESNGNMSVLQATTDLTVRLSRAKFGQQQLQEPHDDMNGNVSVASSDVDLAPPVTPTTTNTTTSTVTKKQAPDLRIKAVPSIERVAHVHARSSSFSSTKAVVPTTNTISKKAKSTNKNGKSVKQQSKTDASKDAQGEINRPRSDSVSDIVTAKLGAEKTAKADADKTVKNAPTGATPASVRVKRGRGEDNEVTASTHKRSRQSHKDA